MALSSAGIFSPERSDDQLGDGWQWSERHLCRVVSERLKIYVQADALWVKVRNSNQGAVCITTDDEPEDFPVVKMVMLTYFPAAIDEITETFISR
jgi:hypothetical protein